MSVDDSIETPKALPLGTLPLGMMRDGDVFGYRVGTVDSFREIELSVVKASQQQSNGFGSLDGIAGNVWVPPLVDPELGASPRDLLLKTGGRTAAFITDEHDVTIDLKEYGWHDAHVQQTFRPEVKGAGTLIADSGVSLGALRADGKLSSLIDGLKEPILCISSKDDRDRPKGAQKHYYGEHSLSVTSQLLGQFPVKFAPTVFLSPLPAGVINRIGVVDKTLNGEKRCADPQFAQEVRYTPSTVRAIYFDKASNDGSLRTLCSRVSEDRTVLAGALGFMVRDIRTYLETLSLTTRKSGHYTWAKVGDIHLSWKKDGGDKWDDGEVQTYKHNHPYAWYLAKDTTVAGSGFWFVDLESLRYGPVRQRSSSASDLQKQQELFVLCVLRDFSRVATQFEIGRRLLDGEVPAQERRSIQEDVLSRIVGGVNASDYLRMKSKGDGYRIDWGFKDVSLDLSTTIARSQLYPRY